MLYNYVCISTLQHQRSQAFLFRPRALSSFNSSAKCTSRMSSVRPKPTWPIGWELHCLKSSSNTRWGTEPAREVERWGLSHAKILEIQLAARKLEKRELQPGESGLPPYLTAFMPRALADRPPSEVLSAVAEWSRVETKCTLNQLWRLTEEREDNRWESGHWSTRCCWKKNARSNYTYKGEWWLIC